MNYRHAFHAGNAADCMKHALLVWLLDALHRKPAPIFVLDTHAGVGSYDLLEGPAERTGEWRDGIARLLHDPPEPLNRYVQLATNEPSPSGRGQGEAAAANPPSMTYPGSPALIRALLRPDDRLACCELHPEDYAQLRRRFARDRQVAVHLRDGYEAIRALLPPRQTRGLILIDPPYEAPGELDRVVQALEDGAARFNHGIYGAWYPIKHRAPITTFHEAIRLAALRDVVAAEWWWRTPTDPARLNGCGLLVRNPPYGFEAGAEAILQALDARLSEPGAGQGTHILRLTNE